MEKTDKSGLDPIPVQRYLEDESKAANERQALVGPLIQSKVVFTSRLFYD